MKEIEVLRELQKFLVQFRDDIEAKSAEFNSKVMQLREIGVPIQIAEYYEANYGVQNIQHLQNLIVNITENDLPYINTQIAQFEQTFIGQDKNMVYQGYSGTPFYRIEGNMIYQGYSGIPVYRIEGNMIYQGYSGIPVYRIEGNMIYKGYSGIPVNRIE